MAVNNNIQVEDTMKVYYVPIVDNKIIIQTIIK